MKSMIKTKVATKPNPQGKGLTPLLEGINQHNFTHYVPPKQVDQIEMELFTSLFVLQSQFTFNPVVERSYWLYQKADGFALMLVAPDEWVSPYQGTFIGECILQGDRTWTVILSDVMAEDADFMQFLENERQKLKFCLESAATIEDALPVYEGSFSFYARILAFSLSRSLDTSMQLAGIKGLSYQEAKGLLTYEKHS